MTSDPDKPPEFNKISYSHWVGVASSLCYANGIHAAGKVYQSVAAVAVKLGIQVPDGLKKKDRLLFVVWEAKKRGFKYARKVKKAAARAKRQSYQTYINSPEWRDFRKRFAEAGLATKCAACNTTKDRGFHHHHKTYVRFGHERLDDVVLLCEPCHVDLHQQYAPGSTVLLWDFTEAFIASKQKEMAVPSKSERRKPHRVHEPPSKFPTSMSSLVVKR